MRTRLYLIFSSIILCGMFLSSVWAEDAILEKHLDDVHSRYETGIADVRKVHVLVSQTDPVEVIVQIDVVLPDACTEIGEVFQSNHTGLIELTVETIRLKEQMCSMQINPYRLNHHLDLTDLHSGVYHVDVHGHTGTFVLP